MILDGVQACFEPVIRAISRPIFALADNLTCALPGQLFAKAVPLPHSDTTSLRLTDSLSRRKGNLT